MGGLGKTTLVKQVYDEIKITFENHAWITVSQSYKIEDLLMDLIEQLHVEITQRLPDARGSRINNIHNLKKMVNTLLNDHNYVAVLDDAWSIDAWKDIEHAFPQNSYRPTEVVLYSQHVMLT